MIVLNPRPVNTPVPLFAQKVHRNAVHRRRLSVCEDSEMLLPVCKSILQGRDHPDPSVPQQQESEVNTEGEAFNF